MINPVKAGCSARPFSNALLLLIPLGLGGLLCACGEGGQQTVAQPAANNLAAAMSDAVPVAPVATGRVEKGMYFRPELSDYELHNEYDDDGDSDGVKETHVRRYINSTGDSAFSLTTRGTLWAWSLDIKGDDDSDIHKNYVIRDSNCDTVFDERYSLDAQFHVPECLAVSGAGEKTGGM